MSEILTDSRTFEEDRDIIRKKLLLIKELEVVTGVSLKDAKEAVKFLASKA